MENVTLHQLKTLCLPKTKKKRSKHIVTNENKKLSYRFTLFCKPSSQSVFVS